MGGKGRMRSHIIIRCVGKGKIMDNFPVISVIFEDGNLLVRKGGTCGLIFERP